MAAENRTALQATLDALTAVVSLADLKTALTNFVDSMIMNRDVQDTVTIAGTGSTDIDFDGVDVMKVISDYDCTLNITNISDGDFKFLWLSKTAGKTVSFTGATSEEIDTTYTTTLTDMVFVMTKKFYGTVMAIPLTTSFDLSAVQADITAIEGRIGTVNIYTTAINNWNMDSTASVTFGPASPPWALANIISVTAMILNDAGDTAYQLTVAGTINVDSSINLARTGSGFFDSTDFDDATMNRGHVTILYIDAT